MGRRGKGTSSRPRTPQPPVLRLCARVVALRCLLPLVVADADTLEVDDPFADAESDAQSLLVA